MSKAKDINIFFRKEEFTFPNSDKKFTIFDGKFESTFGDALYEELLEKKVELQHIEDDQLYIKKLIDPDFTVYFRRRQFREYYYDVEKVTDQERKMHRLYQLRMDPAGIKELENLGFIEWAEEDYFNVQFVSDEEFFAQQWNLQKIDIEEAWNLVRSRMLSFRGEETETIVATVDSGFDHQHTDFRDRLHFVDGLTRNIVGFDAFLNQPIYESDPTELYESRHGTAVSGTIVAAKNERRIVGAAPEFGITSLNIKAFPDGQDSTLAAAIYYAIDKGARVINCSWGPLYHRPNAISRTLAFVIDFAKRKNILCVFAAGNQGNDVSGYFPANSPDVITVGATNTRDMYAEFSNWGEGIDVVAPGESILTLANQNKVRVLRGTSFAAPLVSATIALLLAACPDTVFTVQMIRELLQKTSDPAYSLESLHDPIAGRLNAAAFVKKGIQDYC